MSGNAHQRRKARRAKEREARKKMEWKEPLPSGYRFPTDEEIESIRDGDPPHEVEIQPPKPIVQPEPPGEAEGVLYTNEGYQIWREMAVDACRHNEGAWIGKWPQTAIRHCTNLLPNGEACRFALEIVPGEDTGPTIWVSPKKKRGIWNWLRKLVGR